MSDFDPDKKPWRERIGDVRRFANDHKVECAYIAGSVTGAFIATLLVKEVKISGVKQIAEHLLDEIKRSHAAEDAAIIAANDMRDFIAHKGLSTEFVKAFGKPIYPDLVDI